MACGTSGGCGGGKAGGQADYGRLLKLAMLTYLALALVLLGAGNTAASLALGGGAVLFLVNATSYGVGFWTVGRTLSARAQALLIKGILLMAGSGLVLALAISHAGSLVLPEIGIVVLAALLAAALSVVAATILFASRKGAASGRAVWLSSRREVLAMLAVALSALAVHLTGTGIPDLVVGAGLAVYGLITGIAAAGQGISDLRGQVAA